MHKFNSMTVSSRAAPSKIEGGFESSSIIQHPMMVACHKNVVPYVHKCL